MSRAIKSALVALLCGLLLAGCAVRFVYNQLDWLVPWYLEDYIELEGPQEKLFEARLEAYLAWHRQEQLPIYADFLESVADAAEQGLTEADIASIQARTQSLAQTLIDKLEPDMMDLFAMASDKQVQSLFKKFASDNEQYRKDVLEVSVDKQRRQRGKEAQHYVERWTGSLDKQQRQLIDDWSQSYEIMGEELFETQLAWQGEFHRILDLRHDKPVYEKAFRALLDNPEFGRSAALQQKLDQNERAVVQLYLQLDQSLTKSQRQHMVKKLRSYAEDFRALARQ